jgi:hypothetical protein
VSTQQPQQADPMAQRETLLLVRAYYSIQDPAVRRRMLDLMRSMGSETGADETSR